MIPNHSKYRMPEKLENPSLSGILFTILVIEYIYNIYNTIIPPLKMQVNLLIVYANLLFFAAE